jgi:hypothetical protein
MSEREKLRAQMIENAAEINRLRQLNDDSVWNGPEPPDFGMSRSDVCTEFHRRYSQLCVPGGCDDGFIDRLKAGDYFTVEAALCFLEMRPYFFRSGYMWRDLLRKCKRVPMNEEQSSRFLALLERYSEWKADRDAKARRGLKVRNDLSALFLRFERIFPVYFRDSELDGVTCVGDLYGVLCRALKIDALKESEKSGGVARKPYSPGKFVRFPLFELMKSNSHRISSWNAADVWATLTATTREVYALDDEFSIGVETVLPITRKRKE